MKTELDFGYTLEIYEKGNYGTVKSKFFDDMMDLITFTNTNARKYNGYCINVFDKTKHKEIYKGCIHKFLAKVGKALLLSDINSY